ncbi:glycosyltransferase [Emticicia fluvialis]|uniref:glycosyltransferase n=1 Tax=Emticicia fluvialis TaxID=2974474 RepID=UPI00216643F6|nr:glycosyltransferase [Emticicia fluvialis]
MKVLWFTNTPSLYKFNKSSDKGYNGGGWISSLESMMRTQTQIELAVSFLDSDSNFKVKTDSTTYYPIPLKKRGGLLKLIHNWSCNLDTDIYVKYCLEIINDFKPDVIHIFGTEGVFSSIIPLVNLPVVIHLQGLLNPYLNSYYPNDFNDYDVLFNKGYFKNNLLGNSILFNKWRFQKSAKREMSYFKAATNLMGRTDWDKKISQLLAPNADYFHIDEVLRTPFYDSHSWEFKENNKLTIISTISNTIYKGLDLILKTAKILKENSGVIFRWQVVGLNSNDKFVNFIEKKVNIKAKDFCIEFNGVMDSDKLINAILNSDVFVHPSYIDNSPNSVCEAQLLGIPIIACNVGGLSTLIHHNISGILVPANAPYEMAFEILSLFKDSNKAQKIGSDGRSKATARHDREKILSDTLSIYDKIVNKRE